VFLDLHTQDFIPPAKNTVQAFVVIVSLVGFFFQARHLVVSEFLAFSVATFTKSLIPVQEGLILVLAISGLCLLNFRRNQGQC
jgi:hypothetical protein